MANKTTKGRLAKYPSTALTFKLFAAGSDTVANGSGDSATTGANGSFSFIVTEALSGWYDVVAYEGSTLRGFGKVFYPGDVVGTYYVDDPDKPQVYPPLYRSADDTQAIRFLWPVDDDTITATVSINGATPVAVSGAITQTALTANGQYFYELAYDADDRPTAEGTALYVFSGNGYTGYLTLEVSPSLGNLALLGTGNANINAIVAEDGTIEELIIGDDYLDANGRALSWTVDPVVGFNIGDVTAYFGATLNGKKLWKVAGTVSAVSGKWLVKAELPKTYTEGLKEACVDWSVELTANGVEITKVKPASSAMQLVSKST